MVFVLLPYTGPNQILNTYTKKITMVIFNYSMYIMYALFVINCNLNYIAKELTYTPTTHIYSTHTIAYSQAYTHMCTHTHTHMQLHAYAHTYTHTHTHTHIHTHSHLHAHAHTHTHTHIHKHTHTHTNHTCNVCLCCVYVLVCVSVCRFTGTIVYFIDIFWRCV